MRQWRRESSESIFHHPLLALERQRVEAGPGEVRDVLVLDAPEWVNVVPLLPDGRLVMVRQWRFGIGAPTLEIPGGMVEDAAMGSRPGAQLAAERELREETGYRAGRSRLLGNVTPNPAIFANRCPTYLATDLELVGEPQSGLDEELTVELVPLAAVPGMLRSGEIHHALVIAALMHLALDREAGGPLRDAMAG
jgi:ADP-ribose pyrophosphatase